MRLLVLALTVFACRDSAKVQPVKPDPAQAHGAGRDRWRGGGVYLDGKPIGMLKYAELPRGLAPMWETQRTRLPFKAGEEIRYSETKVPRFRVTDYLAAIGVSLDEVNEVHFHGARDSAIVLTRADLKAHGDDILFKFAGDTWGKPIPMVRGIPVATSFDDLMAMTIYMKKAPPKLNGDETLELDGHPVKGIPYHGEPVRNGIRVYVDDKLAAVLKRNQLAGVQTLRLVDVLEKEGVDTKGITREQLIWDETRKSEIAFADAEFTFANTGEIKFGAESAEAIALYSK